MNKYKSVLILHKKMPRRNSSQRPSSYVVRLLATRITDLARGWHTYDERTFAQERILDYIQDIGIHDTYIERVSLASIRLIINPRSVDIEYVLGAITGIFDTMYPHDEN
jgi:hypothetical protein